jgi:predicted MFS family arabinose efflux permease
MRCRSVVPDGHLAKLAVRTSFEPISLRPSPSRSRIVATLGTAQCLAWASSYYLLAILAVPMARDLHVTVATVFGAFSVALVVGALAGPRLGRTIDSRGGRPVLMGSNLVFAAGLAGLGLAEGIGTLFVAWAVVGIGMAGGLYEAAFAALVRIYGRESRNVITGIALLGGLASTVGWPLSAWLESHFGWRGACFTWAALHVALGLPLNWSLPKAAAPAVQEVAIEASSPERSETAASGRTIVLLSVFYAITWFISTAMAAHLPRLLVLSGMSLTAAVGIGALIGPAQVGGRLLEFGFLRRFHPLQSARLGALLHPIGAVLLLTVGAPAAAAFGVLHGAGNGILTIAKGTLPLVLFGPTGYGARQGLLTVPARVAQASAPWLFGLCLEAWGAKALWVCAAIGLAAVVILMLFHEPKAHESPLLAKAPGLPR